MSRKNKNTYYEKDDYMVGVCSSGVEYFIDKEDYERIKDYVCWSQGECSIFFYNDGVTYSLPKYLMDNNEKGEKVLHKNHDSRDNRKSNLYVGNVFVDCNDYYEVYDYADKKFLIDKEDYETVKAYKWHVDYQGYVIAKTQDGKTIKLHRLLLGIIDDSTNEVDHINRIRYDNRKNNLRLADRAMNMRNTNLSSANKSGCKGVYWSKSANKWCVQITKDKQKYYLGSYDNKEEAIKVRQKAEQDLSM